MSTNITPADDAEWISQAEAARMRGVSRQAIARLVRRGRLRTRFVAGRALVSRTDVLEFQPRSAGRPAARERSEA